ncbi:hypothetical protein ACFU8W_36250 [Streptomyces sp. NPDC057565]|uniref:hypothetical protein n=1 Tax=Streptomyces sp. NPDC057565 TaxID=3346169 RepID=UPI0036BB547E
MAVLVALAALVIACGDGADRVGAEKPTTAADTGVGAGTSGKPAAGTVDFATVLNTEQKIQSALPEPAQMHEWTPKTGCAHVEEQPKSPSECGPETDWDCGVIATGTASFEAFGETVIFSIRAYADQKATQDACRKEAASSAKYTKANVPPVDGVTSHAYYRNAGNLDGLDLIMCTGTVMAKIRLEGSGSNLDPASAHTMAQGVFLPRIQKAAAAS